MKYKYYTYGIVLILLITGLTSFVSAAQYDTDTPSLRIIIESISPEPVEPGQDLTLKVRLVNEGGKNAENVSMELNNVYPFFIKNQDKEIKGTSICTGCSLDNTYYLLVDSNAKSGIYPLDFTIRMGETTIIPSETANIKVIGKPDIILNAEPLTKKISSGDTLTLSVTASNIGTGIARSIKIIPSSDNIIMIGSNIKLIDELKPDQKNKFNLTFVIKETLTPDTYKFPIKIEYLDEQGNKYTNNYDIGINILEKASIDIQSIKIDPPYPTLVDNVHMEGIIENTGTGDAENVVVELITPNNQTYKSFVGQLEANDDAPFYFDIKPSSSGINTAILKITYTDDYGTHTITTKISKEVKKPTNNLILVILLISAIVLIILYSIYKKRKKGSH